MPERSAIPDSLREKTRQWEEVWGVPGLMDALTIEFSSRFRTSLGLCRPAQGRIRLAVGLLDAEGPAVGGGSLLEEVLCHELAHVAVHRLHGREAKPHGPEWKRLVREAGFEPRLRIQNKEVHGTSQGPEGARTLPRPRWEHRCPVCQARRVAGRPVRQWRCVACRGAGLSGKLVITKLPPPDQGAGR